MNQKEEWKDIPGYEGLYQISNYGRVKSFNWRHWGYTRVLKPQPIGNGYLHVYLHKDKAIQHYYVHRLVAAAFVPNPDNKEEVNHINEDKTDNRACNLDWVSHEENNNWGTKNMRSSKKQKGSHWYNNGKVSTLAKECPAGFVRGRLRYN